MVALILEIAGRHRSLPGISYEHSRKENEGGGFEINKETVKFWCNPWSPHQKCSLDVQHKARGFGARDPPGIP